MDSNVTKPKTKYGDLRGFLSELESQGELHQISEPVSPNLEITEICSRTLKRKGPALLFNNVVNSNISVLANLFGTQERIATALGADSTKVFTELGI